MTYMSHINPLTCAPDTPAIMGVLNLTPESFSDGGRFFDAQVVCADAVAAEAVTMARAGANIMDIGAEATSFHRAGTVSIAPAEQIRRLTPALKRTRDALDAAGFKEVLISIDTRSSEVAAAALDQGAAIINDVSGGAYDADMLHLAAARDCPIILMDFRIEAPGERPARHRDLMCDVHSELARIRDAALACGIKRERIILDPGIGFGKAPEDNWQILAAIDHLKTLDCRIAVGFWRKRMTGDILPAGAADWAQRDIASAMMMASLRGTCISIYRVHQVALAKCVVNAWKCLAETSRGV